MYKKFYCFTLLLLIALSITCVAASEDTNAENDAVANVEEIEVASTPIEEINDDSINYDDNELIAAKSNANTKTHPNMNVTVETNNEFVDIKTTIDENATGSVLVQIKDTQSTKYKVSEIIEIENGFARWGEFLAFDKGNYIAEVTYFGDDNYYSEYSCSEFAIEKEKVDFNVYISTDNEFVTIAANVNQFATGNATFRIKPFEETNYTEYANLELENGIAIWSDQTPFNKGDYVAYTTYSGDENYFSESSIQTFSIEKEISQLNTEITVNDCFVKLNVNVSPNATGNVTINIKKSEEEEYKEYATLELENGTATWAEFIAFHKGDYVAYTTYSGDENYFKTANTQTFTIEKELPEINVDITAENEYLTITTKLAPDATGNVTINMKKFEEKNYKEYATLELENGTATWADYVAFSKGDYVAFITYSGDENYFKTASTQTFEIGKQTPDFNVNITVDECFVEVNATLPKNATGTVTINIKTFEDENYTEYAELEVENGTAIWAQLIQFNKGDYVAYTTYSGDENYFKTADTQTFTIEKQFPNMLINSTVEGNNTTINITLPDNATGTVEIVNNETGESKNFTLDGNSIIVNEELNIGYNIFQIRYSGDDYYFGAGTTFVEIIKQETVLTTTKSKVTVTYSKEGKITAELKLANGNSTLDGENIIVVVKNRVYNATLVNGKATIKIVTESKLVPKTYTAKVLFEGNDLLENASTTFKLVVKKATPKLTAKAKTFKVSTKTKKYIITLKKPNGKAVKNAELTIKVNGKTFKATTNSKGKATFKITNLNKKAKYIAMVNLAATKYYNNINKKVVITTKY